MANGPDREPVILPSVLRIGVPPSQTAQVHADHDLLRGLVSTAVESGSSATMSDRDVLLHVEADVLNRWRSAMVAQDSAGVSTLVAIGHVVAKALHAPPQVTQESQSSYGAQA